MMWDGKDEETGDNMNTAWPVVGIRPDEYRKPTSGVRARASVHVRVCVRVCVGVRMYVCVYVRVYRVEIQS